MPTGKVKWYDVDKGFGFLAQDEGEDVYVRSSALPAGVEGLKAGQRVVAGQRIGGMGSEGFSTGSHLHFEIHPTGDGAVDPVPWLAERGINV